MAAPAYLGEFELQVLLVVIRLRDNAFGPDVARELETRAGRRVSRGALYTTFDRLDDKGLLRWRTVPGTEVRTKPRGPFAGMSAKSAGSLSVANDQGPSRPGALNQRPEAR